MTDFIHYYLAIGFTIFLFIFLYLTYQIMVTLRDAKMLIRKANELVSEVQIVRDKVKISLLGKLLTLVRFIRV